MFVFIHSFQYLPAIFAWSVVVKNSHVMTNFPIGLHATDGADNGVIATILPIIRDIFQLPGVETLSLRTTGDLVIVLEKQVGHHLGCQPVQAGLGGLEAADFTAQTLPLLVHRSQVLRQCSFEHSFGTDTAGFFFYGPLRASWCRDFLDVISLSATDNVRS